MQKKERSVQKSRGVWCMVVDFKSDRMNGGNCQGNSGQTDTTNHGCCQKVVKQCKKGRRVIKQRNERGPDHIVHRLLYIGHALLLLSSPLFFSFLSFSSLPPTFHSLHSDPLPSTFLLSFSPIDIPLLCFSTYHHTNIPTSHLIPSSSVNSSDSQLTPNGQVDHQENVLPFLPILILHLPSTKPRSPHPPRRRNLLFPRIHLSIQRLIRRLHRRGRPGTVCTL